MTPPAVVPHPPKQERSRRTLERIVEGALAVVADEGWDAATVGKILQRAGVSVGSFYARFGSKDELFAYVEQRLWDAAEAHWSQAYEGVAWAELDLAGTLREALGLLAGTLGLGRAQLALLPSVAGAASPGPRARRLERRMLTDLGALLARHQERIPPERRGPAAEAAFRVALAVLRGAGPPSPAPEPPPGGPAAGGSLLPTLAEMLVSFFGATGAGPAEPSLDFFEVWQ